MVFDLQAGEEHAGEIIGSGYLQAFLLVFVIFTLMLAWEVHTF